MTSPAAIRFIREGLDWSGVSARAPFLVISLITLGLMVWMSAAPVLSWQKTIFVVLLACALVLYFGHARRRLRDMDASGWWMWVFLIPVVSLILLLTLLFKRGTPDARDGSWSKAGFALVIILALMVLSRIIWAPFWIPAGSMKPTLLVGDYLLVSRVAQEPERGDILVFRHPVSGHDFIKRLIGLPGDGIQLVNGVLRINGTSVVLQDAAEFEEVMQVQGPSGMMPRCGNGPVQMGEICKKQRQIETLPNGVEYATLNIMDQQQDNTGLYSVPDGHYFFLGDNRDNSLDSRMPLQIGGVGFVPYENLIGRADWIVFSSAGMSLLWFWTWRSDRFLKAVI